jgi:hypothetical protein
MECWRDEPRRSQRPDTALLHYSLTPILHHLTLDDLVLL